MLANKKVNPKKTKDDISKHKSNRPKNPRISKRRNKDAHRIRKKTILKIYCQKILTFFFPFLPSQFRPQRKRSDKNQQFRAKRKRTAARKAESPPRSEKDSRKPPPILPSPILRPSQDGLRRFLHTIIPAISCGSQRRQSVTSAYDLRRPAFPWPKASGRGRARDGKKKSGGRRSRESK